MSFIMQAMHRACVTKALPLPSENPEQWQHHWQLILARMSQKWRDSKKHRAQNYPLHDPID